MQNTKNIEKDSFIKTFFNFVEDVIKTTNDLIIYESLSKKMIRIGGYDPQKLFRGFKNLERRGIIRNINQNNYQFTRSGLSWLEKKVHNRRFLNKPWDNKWRIIIFDIPQELHRERNSFRRKLYKLGCYMLQKSVFVFPHDCSVEIGDFAKDLKISAHIDIMRADSVGFREEEIKRFFCLD